MRVCELYISQSLAKEDDCFYSVICLIQSKICRIGHAKNSPKDFGCIKFPVVKATCAKAGKSCKSTEQEAEKWKQECLVFLSWQLLISFIILNFLLCCLFRFSLRDLAAVSLGSGHLWLYFGQIFNIFIWFFPTQLCASKFVLNFTVIFFHFLTLLTAVGSGTQQLWCSSPLPAACFIR